MSNYWPKRESEHIEQMLKKHVDYEKYIHKLYLNLWDEINAEIEKFYANYAGKEKISIKEAKEAASKFDVQAFAEQAKKYVETRDFSKEANDQLRIYNLTMRANRLELLKSKIGMFLTGTTEELQTYLKQQLTDDAVAEWARQSGILGTTVLQVKEYKMIIESIVEASYHNATFSQRLWSNQDILKSELDRLLTKGLTAGYHPDVLAKQLRKLVLVDNLRGGVETADYVARRLMLSEATRIQSEVQKRSYELYEYEKYDFIPESTACPKCKGIAANGPYKTENMMPGENASPIHNWCRCSTVPSVEEAEPFDWSKEMGGISTKANDAINASHHAAYQVGKTLERELLSLIDLKTGNLVHQSIGEENKVVFDETLLKQLKTAKKSSYVLTHNHPGKYNSSFSEADIQQLFTFNSIKSLTLINGDGQYLLDRNNKYFNVLQKVYFNNYHDKMSKEIITKYGEDEKLWGKIVDEINQSIAGKFKLTYKKVK